MADIITAKDLCLWYGETQALKSINMNIPEHLEVKEEDIETLARRALREGNPQYPVPKIINKSEMMALIRRIGGLD